MTRSMRLSSRSKFTFIAAAVVSLFALVAFPLSASAAPIRTIVTGKVTKAGNVPVSGASVTVKCGSVSETDPTDSDGQYSVSFDPNDCPDGATATAQASSSDGSGANSGTVNTEQLSSGVELNIAIVDVQVAVPEMGTIVGGMTAVAAGGAFLIIRRKQQLGNS